MFNILPFLIIIISLCVIIYIIVRKFPVISTLDIDSIPKERDAKIKKKIMNERMIRILKHKFAGIGKKTAQIGVGLANISQKAKDSLKKLEKKYEKEHISKMKEHIKDAQTQELPNIEKHIEKVENKISKLLKDAKTELDEGNDKESEQIYLQIISLEPKNIDAFKGLADVYILQKEWKLAKDTLLYIIKLDHKDEDVYFELGEISLELGDKKSAWKYIAKALDLNVNNPKYLDLAIEVCLQLGKKKEASICIDKLVEVNPKNNKIANFKERLNQKD